MALHGEVGEFRRVVEVRDRAFGVAVVGNP